MKNNSKHYLVKYISNGELKISGKGNHPLWERANVLLDFSSPWDSKDIKKIEFRSIYDTEKLFFCFKVHDSEIHTHPSKDTYESINNSDRVELFFRKNSNLKPYYCLEIDSSPRLMDFKALPNKIFDFNWNWPSNEIELKSSIFRNHFIVEGSISIASLSNFGLINGGKIEAGIYRAKYNQLNNGLCEPTWITWVDPKTKSPNFHTPTSFGLLELENK